MRATIVDCAYGRELCALQALHANIAFTGISFSKEDMRLISPRLHVIYADSLQHAPDIVPAEQDYIILREEIEDAEERISLLERLAEKLRLGGKLVWREAGQVRTEELA